MAVRTGVRTKRAIVVLAFGALALLAAACGGSEQDVEFAASDDPILSGDFHTLGGGTIDLASLQGQDVVLWFWAPW